VWDDMPLLLVVAFCGRDLLFHISRRYQAIYGLGSRPLFRLF
jgi:hypothetical protein